MSTPATQPSAAPTHSHGNSRWGRAVLLTMRTLVLVLSVLLIVYISIDTFNNINLLSNSRYMQFQFWVCIVFILDFFVEMYFAESRWRYFKRRVWFLLLSIPYLNIVTEMQLTLSPDALYFVRFIPLARGALALSIVFGYFSDNAMASFFNSYLVMLVMVVYFCSLIFYQCEHAVNPQVDSYLTALWWSAMNMVTVGCYINPMTATGRILAVVLPTAGIIVFPLFTVYISDYVKRKSTEQR